MRNTEFLDNKRQEDSGIGELGTDEDGRFYRIVNGSKIYQVEEKTQRDADLNLTINRVRASGMSAHEYLKSLYR